MMSLYFEIMGVDGGRKREIYEGGDQQVRSCRREERKRAARVEVGGIETIGGGESHEAKSKEEEGILGGGLLG